MGNMKLRKLWVLALCCAVATGSLPRLDLGTMQLTNAMQSVFDLQSKLEQLKQPETQAEPFVSLYYDAKKDTLFKDGVPVGDRCGEYAVVNGEVMLSAKAAGVAGEKDGFVSLEQASKQMGCQVTVDEGGVTVTSPFDSACLIVKSESKPEPYGAIDCADGYRDLYVLQYATPAAAYAAYEKYQADESILFVEPSRTVSVAAVGGSQQAYTYTMDENTDWGVTAIGADSYNGWLTAAYDSLPEITVAVVDTGLYFEHERLQGRIAGRGAAFLDEDNYSVDDEHGHGTHCAGIITGATTDNVKILPVRSLDGGGYGSILGIYCGMIYALEQGVDVVSMSLGIDGESPLVQDATRMLYENGILCCVASGNESMNADYITPARSEYCLTVGALDENLEIAYFSNYGEIVDVAAPGVDVLSAGIDAPDQYVSMSGTSMATPYVAACCAMVLSADENLSLLEVENYLKANAMDLGDAGKDDYYGYGMVYMKDFRFSGERCEMPSADFDSGSYDDTLTVTLSCDTENASIYYTLDGSVPSAENGTLYTGPITISSSAVLSAVAVSGELSSSILKRQYLIDGKDIADALVIENGVLVKYNGVLTELDLVDMTDLVAVGDEAFKDNQMLEEVLLPGSVRSIGNSAFENCKALWNMEAYGCTSIGDACFRNCTELSWADTDELTSVGEAAFENCRSLYRVSISDELTEIPARMMSGASYSGELYLPNVTVVGENAFTDCTYVVLDLNWSALTSIGKEAFAGCNLTDLEISLDSVEALNEGVFRGASRMKSFSMPAKFTTVPAGFLEDTWSLQYLSAPGVTYVEDYGLAIFSDEPTIETDIPFEKITFVGEGGFFGFPFDRFTEFTALTECSLGSFAGSLGAPLSFPALESIPEQAFIMNCNSVLYFENAVSVGSMAFAMYGSPVVLSEKCTDFADDAFDEIGCIAAPAGSAAEEYAITHGMEFRETPDVLIEDFEPVFTMLDTPVLVALGLGFGLSYQWYDADGNAITGATENTYYPNLKAGESKNYSVTVTDADGEVVGTFTFIATYEEPVIGYELQLDQMVIPEYETVRQEWEEITDGIEYADFTIYRYFSFVPETDGTYYFILDDYNSFNTILLPDVNAVLYEGYRYEYLEAELTAGKEYILMLEYTDSDFLCTLTVTQNDPMDKYDISDCYWENSEDYDSVIPENYPYEPKPVLYDPYYRDGVLTEGVDYILHYENNNAPGVMYVYAFGIGEYIGCVSKLEIQLTAVLEEDVPMFVDPSQSDDVNLIFVPEESGEYLITAAYPMELLLLNSDEAVDLILNCDPTLSIYDDEGLVDLYCDDYDGLWQSTYLPAIRVELTAGVEYHINPGSYSDGPYELMVTRSRLNMLDCGVMSTSFADGAYTIEVCDGDYNALTEGKDFAVEYFESEKGFYAVVYGIGKYYGTLYVELSSGSGEDVELEPCVSITPDVAFMYDPTAASYRFSVEKSSYFSLLADEHEGQEFKFYEYFEEDDYVSFYTSGALGEDYQFWFGPGEYILMFYEPDSLAETEMVLKMHKDLSDADVEVEDLLYTGKPQMPEIVVTYDGVVLEEDVDYWIEYYGDVPVNCGNYSFWINGMGDYAGSRYVGFSILPDVSLANGQLIDGYNEIDIREAGTTNIYTWVPEASGLYGIASTNIEDVVVSVMDENSNAICDFFGYDCAYGFVNVVAGRTYYVAARYDTTDMVGSFYLRIEQGLKDLSQCEVIVEGPIFENGEAQTPDFTVYDDGIALVEGEDYILVTFGSNTYVGRGVIELLGTGKYLGRLEGDFIIYAEELPDEVVGELVEGETTVVLPWNFPDSTELYSFTNTTGADFIFSIEEDDYDDILLIQAYDINGNAITDFDPEAFQLAADETIYLLMIIDRVMWYEGCEAALTIYGKKSFTMTYDGVIYEVDTDGYATVVGVEDDRMCCTIPETFFDDVYLNMDIIVTGYDEAFLYDVMWNQKIFYVDSLDTAMAQDMIEDGYVVVCLDNVTHKIGDADGNGAVEVQDMILLNAWITQVEGVQIAEQNLANCDCNGDGIIDFNDVVMLYSL